MASSHPPPFEELKEGFLCPLCLKDLQTFCQLKDHYEEEHSGDDRHVRGQIKSESTDRSGFFQVFFSPSLQKHFILNSILLRFGAEGQEGQRPAPEEGWGGQGGDWLLRVILLWGCRPLHVGASGTG